MECWHCRLPNISDSFFLTDEIETSNSFSVLSDTIESSKNDHEMRQGHQPKHGKGRKKLGNSRS